MRDEPAAFPVPSSVAPSISGCRSCPYARCRTATQSRDDNESDQDPGDDAGEEYLKGMCRARPRHANLPSGRRLLHNDDTFPHAQPAALDVDALAIDLMHLDVRPWPAVPPTGVDGCWLGCRSRWVARRSGINGRRRKQVHPQHEGHQQSDRRTSNRWDDKPVFSRVVSLRFQCLSIES